MHSIQASILRCWPCLAFFKAPCQYGRPFSPHPSPINVQANTLPLRRPAPQRSAIVACPGQKLRSREQGAGTITHLRSMPRKPYQMR